MRLPDDDLIAALREHGSNAKAAKALGLNIRTVERRRTALALKGYSPEHNMTRTVPDGFTASGVSTLYREDGTVAAQWVKSRQAPGAQTAELLDETIAAILSTLPVLKPRKATGKYVKGEMACYVIGDAHVGMLAWAAECGKSWDLDIAERVHVEVMDNVVGRTPRSEKATIVNLGDWYHYDGMVAETPRSGHALDADGRYPKMLDVGVVIMCRMIDRALEHHKTVHVVNVAGNHDESTARTLSAIIYHCYKSNRRVTVDRTPSLFHYIEHGNTFIGIHHGHTCKAEKLPGVMAADRPEEWGRARYRYWWTGHVHHQSVREFAGVTVETFNTLAAKDAYATNGGWRAREAMTCIVVGERGGQVQRIFGNEEIAGLERKAA